jgi:putative colanic acid biosynthesis acetyltransferase WcaF
MINHDTFSGPSFSLRNRLGRALWYIVCLFLFRYTPASFFAWRALLLRCFGGKIAKGVHVYPKVRIWAPWNLRLENECGIANGVILYCQDTITIGRRSVISQGSHLVTGTHDYHKIGFPLLTKPIVIGDHVWIAADAFIHPGVTIGSGCVVGARSVVTKNMPSWMICTGHPCQPIKQREFEANYKLI